MDSGHQTLNDAKLLVDDLSERSKAVGGARGVREDRDVGLVGLLVDADNVHGSVVRGSGDDDTLGATLEMSRGLLLLGENTGRLNYHLNACDPNQEKPTKKQAAV